MKFKCPLCGQAVSPSIYQKITGIWEERNRVLSKIRAQKADLITKIRQQKASLREQKKNFKQHKAELIQNAVERETKKLTRSLDLLRKKEQKLEERANKRIENAIKSSHIKAEKLADKLTHQRITELKRGLRSSVKEQIRKEREKATEKVTKKYESLQNTFRSTLQQMKTERKELKKSKGRIEELERQLKKQTTPQIEGLLYEDTLLAALKKTFRDDNFDHTGKGGDIIQKVVCNSDEAGIIVYECKRVKSYSSKHVTQALVAKEKRNGDFAILVTNAMKKGTQGFFSERGVMVVHATGVLSLASVLRAQVARIAEMKLGQLEREAAVKLTLEYLEGSEFSNSMESIIGETMSLYGALKDEMKKHFSDWKNRYDSYAKINSEALAVKHTTKAVMTGKEDYKLLIPKNEYPELIEFPLIER